MLLFKHEFRVDAPLEAVHAFHLDPAGLPRLTPPPILVQMLDAPASVVDGTMMTFRLWLGPIPVRWVAQFHDMHDFGFVDSQMEGPFASWIHTHRFEQDSTGGTIIFDQIEASLSNRPASWLLGAGLWLGLPLLFLYRRLRTRGLLRQQLRNSGIT
jgi:ligand-binding SRPBCC domain-containing protein